MQNAINVPRLFSNIGIKDIDFDGDEIQLDDYWQEGVKVPKKALKMIGLKMQYNEAGGCGGRSTVASCSTKAAAGGRAGRSWKRSC